MASTAKVKLPSEEGMKVTVLERLAELQEKLEKEASFLMQPTLPSSTERMYDMFVSKKKVKGSAWDQRTARRHMQELHYRAGDIAEYMALVKLVVAAAKKSLAKTS